jgi:hypothetical protein
MEDLAKFIADVIEFVVGGVFLVASLVLLVHAVSPDTTETVRDQFGDPAGGLSTLYTVGGLAVVYAMGIVAEGVSRMICEWRLRQLTVHRFAVPSTSDPAVLREDLTVVGLCRTNGALERHLADQPRMRPWHVSRLWRRFRLRKRLGKRAEKLREMWRTAAGTAKQQYADNINTQLKRLRIERTLLLSNLIALAAVLILHRWLLGALLVGFGLVLAGLVNERFIRFLNAIVNCYVTAQTLRLLDEDKVDQGEPEPAK